MAEKPLSLDEMIRLAGRVSQWSISREVTDFGNLSVESSVFLDVFGLHGPFESYIANWNYEGQVDGLKVLLDNSAAGSLFHFYLQIGILNGEEFIGCSRRLKESKFPELLALYNKVHKDVTAREKEQREEGRICMVNQGLESARNLLR